MKSPLNHYSGTTPSRKHNIVLSDLLKKSLIQAVYLVKFLNKRQSDSLNLGVIDDWKVDLDCVSGLTMTSKG